MPYRSSPFALILMFVALIASGTVVRGEDRKSIKIGYAISLTGPGAMGALYTELSDYRLWVKDANAAGGIMLSSIGKRVPIEVIEYDDQSNVDEAVKAIDRLIGEDKVDFLLAPWGTEFNIAVGPIFHDAGYPQLVVPTNSDQLPQLIKRWPNSFWFLGTSTDVAQAFVETIATPRAEGKISPRVAIASVADQFGIELAKAARVGLKKSGFQIVYDRSYPVETSDMGPMLNDVKQTRSGCFCRLQLSA